MLKLRGFTIVETLLAVVILASLVTIAAVTYNGGVRQAARSAVFASIKQGSDVLEIQYTRSGDYPPNLAGTEFKPTDGVVTALWTNAPVVRTYSPGSLTDEQNAQLFLNSCNANVPLVVGSKTYFTACTYAGINVHIKGQAGSNIVLHGPSFDKNYALSNMTCSVPECAEIAQTIIQEFEEQGGSWPIKPSGSQVTLPEPDQVTAIGPATDYCLEGRSAKFDDIVAHVLPGVERPKDGPCPDNPDLHYP